MKKNKYWFLAISNDEFEFPLYVAENINELAKKFNRTNLSIRCSICRKQVDIKNNCRYVKVLNVDDNDFLEDKITFSNVSIKFESFLVK